MHPQPEDTKPRSRVIPREEWAGIMQRLADEGKIMPDDDLEIWDITVGDGIEDEEVWWE